jgi:hypothetical protein
MDDIWIERTLRISFGSVFSGDCWGSGQDTSTGELTVIVSIKQ